MLARMTNEQTQARALLPFAMAALMASGCARSGFEPGTFTMVERNDQSTTSKELAIGASSLTISSTPPLVATMDSIKCDNGICTFESKSDCTGKLIKTTAGDVVIEGKGSCGALSGTWLSAAAAAARKKEIEAEIAAEIRRAMYTFEDLQKLDPRALRVLLKEIPQDRLVLALKTASESVKSRVFASMSARAAALIRDDLEAMGSVRLAEVEAAQREVVEAALRLEADGQISLSDDHDLV